MIQIIDYGAGNMKSIQNALKQLGIKSKVISSAEDLKIDSKTIFPGVGAAGDAMKELKARGFDKIIPKIKAPFLGICLGMQLLLDFSEENNTQCLGIINGIVRKFPETVKTPQMGWNKVMPNDDFFYFANSYYVDCKNPVATTNYGINFASIIKKKNFYGVQFHPEKSGEAGLKLLNNFCKSC
jgi:imidazole glycerol-phosphate synthase subunit HisH